MPTPAPGLPYAPLLYLDQKVWVSLLKGSGPASEHLKRLQEAVNQGDVVVGLSAAHYIETWHRGEWTSRWALARLLWDTTRLVALPPLHRLVTGEVADALRLFGVDAPGALVGHVPIGRGVDFAFGSATGRMAYVDDDGRELSLSELPESVRQLHAEAVPYEWVSLAGLPHDMRADGLDLMGQRDAGLRFASYESDLASALGRRRGLPREQRLVVDALRAIEQEFADVCEMSDLDAEPFMRWLFEGDQHRARQFLDAMPSYGTFQILRRLRHENPQKVWESNDRLDLLGLSVALTSCDIVVTEKYWTHVARRAGFDGVGRARVYHSLGAALQDISML